MRLLIESDHPCERLADDMTFLDAGIDVVVPPGPEWLVPPWKCMVKRSTVRFSSELRTAAELVSTQSVGAAPHGGASQAA